MIIDIIPKYVNFCNSNIIYNNYMKITNYLNEKSPTIASNDVGAFLMHYFRQMLKLRCVKSIKNHQPKL